MNWLKINTLLLSGLLSINLTANAATAIENTKPADGTLFQVSTIGALIQGVFAGEYPVKNLQARGDFGLGSPNDIKGEVVGVDGNFYQIMADGKAQVMQGNDRVSYAVVTFFKPTIQFAVNNINDTNALSAKIEQQLPNKNIPYAIRITGNFSAITLRSFPGESQPYPDLKQAMEKQVKFNFNNMQGTLVGFYFPEYLKEVNAPGLHFHFINNNRTIGGHMLAVNIDKANVAIEPIQYVTLFFPHNQDFAQRDLSVNIDDIKKVVSGT